MFEFFLFLIFASSFLIFGMSVIGMIVAVAVSITLMMLLGMLAFAFKLAPWIIVIALVIWLLKKKN